MAIAPWEISWMQIFTKQIMENISSSNAKFCFFCLMAYQILVGYLMPKSPFVYYNVTV